MSQYGYHHIHCDWRVTYVNVIIQLIISILYHMNVRKCYILRHNHSTQMNMYFNVIISPTTLPCQHNI